MKEFPTVLIRSSYIVLLIACLFINNTNAALYTLDLALSGQNEVPANASPATGILTGNYNSNTNVLNFSLMFNGLTGTTTAAHFHGPAPAGTNGGVQIGLAGFPVGVTSGSYSNTFILTPQQESDLLCGLWYINIHSSVLPGGEIRSQLLEGTPSGNITPFEIALTGLNEVPPNATPATGTLTGTFDNVSKVLSFTVKFNGLTGTTTAAHFHGPATPGVNAGVQIGFAGFPAGVTSGSYSNSFVLTPLQESQLLSGLWYVNIHTNVLPGGEIRGQMAEGTLIGDCGGQAIPVSNWALLFGGLLIAGFTVFMVRKRM